MTEFILLALSTGLFSALLADMLDFSMSYGHLLGFIRKLRASLVVRSNRGRIIVLQNETETVELSLKDYWQQTLKSLDELSFEDRESLMSDTYSFLTRYSFWFKAWICSYCMTARLAFLGSIFISFFAYSFGLMTIVTIPVFILLSLVFGHFFIQVINRVL